MKGKIFKIKNAEDELVLPITTTEAVYSEDGKTLNDELDNIENEKATRQEVDIERKRIDNINSSLDNIMNVTNNSKILVSSFNGRDKESLDLYLTADFKELIRLNSNDLFEGQVRDSYMIFTKDETFYCAYTRNSSSGFGISRTKDLISWEHFYINTTGYTKCWAPELFELNGKVYIVLSLQTNNQVETDKYNASIPFFKQYYAEIDLSTMTLGAINEITYSKVSNKIDSTMIVKDNIIYCFVKNEYSKKMEVYTSSALNSQFTYQYTIDYPLDVEGACVCFDGDKYHITLDCFMNNFTVHSEGVDLVNWGQWNVVGDGSVRIQHPSTLLLNDKSEKIINKFYSKNISDESAYKIKRNKVKNKIIYANQIIKNNTLTVPIEECVVVIKGGEMFDITKIDGDVECFYISVYASKENIASITFIQGNNIYTPNGRDFKINAENGTNEALIEVRKIGNNYRFLANDKMGVNPNLVNLSTLAVDGVINNLELENNATYYIDGYKSVVINSTSFKKEGVNPFKCTFTIWSANADASIKLLKTNGKIITPNGNDFLINGNVNGDIHFHFERNYISPSEAGLRMVGTKYEDNKRVNLTTLFTSGSTISNFEPIDGYLYTIGGAEQITINGIESMPDRTRFYLGVFTDNPTAFIKLENGNNLNVPNGEFVLNVANGRNEMIYEVIKMHGTTFRIKGN